MQMTRESEFDHLVDDAGWFEDFQQGQRMRHYRAATVGELEGSGPAKQVMNTAQAHFNDHYLVGSPLGDGRVVFGLATASLVYGLVSQDTAEHAISELGWSRLRFRAPVHHGDTIEAFTEVLATRPADEDEDAGIVEFRHWGRNQAGKIVFEGDRIALVRRRPSLASGNDA
ncbi:bifunctional aldehyde dehydrogenase/enoyl-CoA hydratase [Microbacterium trichothecenolyticum]|uniref:Bifunctional aldehyde dehydrogenase/enoyl-CoA hydratase n=2 Tax=Microbacterium trichothecenolyticum TaxID=69370 RepID=A0A0M2H735_MICTR|nr:bifunctional aldehyde dehydrogenase/enoyl-CoA hydratase [Microbacterium trichothecenolyticum]